MPAKTGRLCESLDTRSAGGDVAGQDNPGNPGSDGASPYQGASPFLPPIVLVLVLVLVLDLLMDARAKAGRYLCESLDTRSAANAWGVTSLGGATRETPVRSRVEI
jgi:hypothetical protein